MSGKLHGEALEKKVKTPTARVFRNGVQNLTSGVVLTLTPNEKLWDNNVFWDMINNQSRLTVRSSGLYLVAAQLEFSATNGGRRAAQLILNGTDIIGDQTAHSASANLLRLTPLTLWPFNVGDYVEVGAFSSVASAAVELEAFWMLAITPEALV